MEANKKIFVHSPDMEKFPYPPQCPFNTSRAGRVYKTLDSMGLLSGPDTEVIAPKSADRKTLEKFHTPEYLDALCRAGRGQFEYDMLDMGLGTSDCPVFEGVYDNAQWIAGATLIAAEQIISEKAKIAFNPSGGLHHAHAGAASGFCYVNDVVLGCKRLAEAGKRVLYLDVDVHHGDGVQEAFYHRSDVMTISLHQSGRTLFPGTGFPSETGTGQGKGYSVNLPLPMGTYDQVYFEAFKEVVLPLIGAYKPDCFVMEIGADGLAGDPLAQLRLTNNIYADIIAELLKFDKPILAVGGGGYNIENTVRAWSLAWTALCGAIPKSTDSQGGLRDRVLPIDDATKDIVEIAVNEVVQEVKKRIFPVHGL